MGGAFWLKVRGQWTHVVQAHCKEVLILLASLHNQTIFMAMTMQRVICTQMLIRTQSIMPLFLKTEECIQLYLWTPMPDFVVVTETINKVMKGGWQLPYSFTLWAATKTGSAAYVLNMCVAISCIPSSSKSLITLPLYCIVSQFFLMQKQPLPHTNTHTPSCIFIILG